MNSHYFYCLDDDIDDLELFQEAATKLGHRASLFRNGIVMLHSLDTSKLPEAIFLDIHMPILDGEEMLHIIKKSDSLKNIPVLLISGACPKKLLRHYLEAGACGMMRKPHGTGWSECLERAIDMWLLPAISAGNHAA